MRDALENSHGHPLSDAQAHAHAQTKINYRELALSVKPWKASSIEENRITLTSL